MEYKDWEETLGRPQVWERALLCWPWKGFQEGENSNSRGVPPPILQGGLTWHCLCGHSLACLFLARRQSILPSSSWISLIACMEALIHEAWLSWTPSQCAEFIGSLEMYKPRLTVYSFKSHTLLQAFLHVFVQSSFIPLIACLNLWLSNCPHSCPSLSWCYPLPSKTNKSLLGQVGRTHPPLSWCWSLWRCVCSTLPRFT